ncbi:hypothetical protein DFS34DRAFT_654243 [Phlyctochytrium arcticum]|nr:hypothetical protein DFS34DRAFT_654243 [Phlyctochytrium arcticum]
MAPNGILRLGENPSHPGPANTLNNFLPYLRTDRKLHDVKIICERDKFEITANKCVLARAPYFYSLFTTTTRPAERNLTVITIPKLFTSKAVEATIQSLYEFYETYLLDMDVTEILEVYRFADFLDFHPPMACAIRALTCIEFSPTSVLLAVRLTFNERAARCGASFDSYHNNVCDYVRKHYESVTGTSNYAALVVDHAEEFRKLSSLLAKKFKDMPEVIPKLERKPGMGLGMHPDMPSGKLFAQQTTGGVSLFRY